MKKRVPKELADLLESFIDELESWLHEEVMPFLPDTEDISDIICDTNADGWAVDDNCVERVTVGYSPGPEGSGLHLDVLIYFHMAGEQRDDRMFCGDTLSGHCTVRVLVGSREWKFLEIAGEVPDPRDPEDYEPDPDEEAIEASMERSEDDPD